MNLNYNIKDSSYENSILISMIIGLLSQVFFEPVMSNFRISLAIIILPICFYILENINIIKIGFLSAMSVYFIRVCTYFFSFRLELEALSNGMKIFFPEIFFYLTYSVIFKLFTSKVYDKRINKIFIICVGADFIGNFIEILFRHFINAEKINAELILGLILIALLRSLIIWIYLNITAKYKIFILRKEHENRYKRLLYTTSKLKTEIYWMEKSMKSTEKLMGDAYNLYTNISTNIDSNAWAEESLDIAKNIHEIKKDNLLALRGLEEVLENTKEDKGLYLSEIYDILQNSLKVQINRDNKKVKIFLKYKKDIYTRNHYCIMSILRNLIMNSIDAIKDKGNIYVHQYEHRIKDIPYYIFTVEDDGMGIKESEIKYIFSPGFSTKINYKTGNINRGLGLSIVRELTYKSLSGFIEVESKEKQGTKFTIYIPQKELENFNDGYNNCRG
ncbi:ATP-binding protein [Clostridium sp.]|uniref:ATP-binding protein n=1 Tax=Clostridium sp. TaxID=1506 RepID=UPI003464CB92